MCGIVGVFSYENIRPELIQSTLNGAQLQKHRGLDYTGVYSDSNIVLTHNKLSILDFSNYSNQPFVFKDVVISFNGEIYNYKDIREKYKFNIKDIDVHIIVQLYELKGIQCISELEGDFAIAIYDKKKKELFLCRDRLGVKQLNYIVKNNNYEWS